MDSALTETASSSSAAPAFDVQLREPSSDCSVSLLRQPDHPGVARPRARCRIASTAASSAPRALASSSTLTTPIAPGLVAAEREVGDVDAVAAEDRADLADDARLIVVPMISSVPASGASTATPRTDTSRGLFGSNTVPSAQRSPSLVCSLIETRLVKCRARALRDLDDLDAALAGGGCARSRSRRRPTESAAARRPPRSSRGCRRRGSRRARRSSAAPSASIRAAPICDDDRRQVVRPAGSTAAGAAARRDGPTESSRRCAPRRRAGNRAPPPPCRGRPVPAPPRSTPRCAASRPPAAAGRAPSRPAAPSRTRRARRRRRCPVSIARRSAASSISSPRAVLMMRMPGFMRGEPLVVEQMPGVRRRRQVQRHDSRPWRRDRRATAARRRRPRRCPAR